MLLFVHCSKLPRCHQVPSTSHKKPFGMYDCNKSLFLTYDSAAIHTFTRRLAVAEADVHGMTLEDVHFHEVGAVDSIVDIVAAALALDHIGADRVVCSPLPMGRGVIRGAAHGPLPGPPPAVVGVLCGAGLWTVDGNCDQELVTPTGTLRLHCIRER